MCVATGCNPTIAMQIFDALQLFDKVKCDMSAHFSLQSSPAPRPLLEKNNGSQFRRPWQEVRSFGGDMNVLHVLWISHAFE